jgi:predicted transcriptional regulator
MSVTPIITTECEKNRENCYKFNITPLMEEIKEIKTNIKELSDGQTQLLIAMNGMPKKMTDEMDKRYADKGTVEDIKDNIKWVTRIVLGVVIIALLGLVVVK